MGREGENCEVTGNGSAELKGSLEKGNNAVDRPTAKIDDYVKGRTGRLWALVNVLTKKCETGGVHTGTQHQGREWLTSSGEGHMGLKDKVTGGAALTIN